MLLSQLQNDGLKLYIDGGQLAVETDIALTVQQRGLLRRYKRQLVSELLQAGDNYKTIIKRVSPMEMLHQYHQRPDETEEQYHDRVIAESLN